MWLIGNAIQEDPFACLPHQICPFFAGSPFLCFFFFLAHLFLALCEKTTGPKASCKNLNKVILANGTRKNVMSLNIATGQRASCDVPDELAIPMNRTDHCSAIDMRADAPL